MSVRDRILAAGVELLHSQGLAAVTQPRIARAAGCSQGHLTYYFPTREDLLLAIAEHSVDLAICPAESLPEADLHTRLATAMAYLPRVRMMVGLVAAADGDAAMRVPLERLVTHIRRRFAGLLQAHGYPMDDARVCLVHAAIVGLAILNLGRQSDASREDIATGLRTLFAQLPSPLPTAADALPPP